jgi:hypothetical protein
MKTKTIKVSGPFFGMRGTQSYCVIQVTDSLEFSPGKHISENVVRTLCMSKGWKVTIVASK